LKRDITSDEKHASLAEEFDGSRCDATALWTDAAKHLSRGDVDGDEMADDGRPAGDRFTLTALNYQQRLVAT